MSSLQLSLMNDEPWHINQTLFDEFYKYMQPNSSVSASAVAERLDSLFQTNQNNKKDRPDDAPYDHITNFFWNIWDCFHISARQLPHNGSEQEKLVECLSVIKNTTGEIPIVKIDAYGGSREHTCRLWQDMYYFEDTFQAMAYLMESQLGNEGEWRNVMAYAARLTRDGTMDLSSYGQSSLIAALGYAIEWVNPRSGPIYCKVVSKDFTLGPQLRHEVAVAADWICYAGEILFEKYGGINDENQIEDIEDGWQFWKMRFEELVGHAHIDRETSELAKGAKEQMEKVETRAKMGK